VKKLKQNYRRFMLIAAVFLVSIFLVACGNKEEDKVEIPTSAVTVIDGDTIKVKMKNKTETVRILSVDAPEMNDPKSGKQPFAEEATTFLTHLIQSGKTLTLEKDVSYRDPYKRFLAYAYVDDKSVEEIMLEKGLVRVYQDPKNQKYLDKYRQIESSAKQKKIGIWSLENYVQQDGFHPEALKTEKVKIIIQNKPFVASTNSDVYHPSSCKKVVDTIKEENRIYFNTEEEAKASGRKRSQVPECWN
jgi:micrococcal nuclease